MKTLIIAAHGEARRDNVAMSDAARPLTPKGRRETSAAAAEFKSLGYSDCVIVTSPAQRAKETAGIWQKDLAVPDQHLHVDQEIYEAERADMLRIVRRLDDAADTVVLVGHNPGVTALLHYLVGRGVEKMSPSSFAVISIDVDRWNRISLRDSKLAQYYVPSANTKFSSLWERGILWRRLRVQKVELFVAFLIGLLVIIGIVIAMFTTRPASQSGKTGPSVNIIDSN